MPHMDPQDNQTLIAPSFAQLYLRPGQSRPSLPLRELAARHELCEDMAQVLSAQVAQQQFQRSIPETLALEHCLQGLLATPEVLGEAEARWVVCRLAELLQWPVPAWASPPAS